jgi:hypothetical protein
MAAVSEWLHLDDPDVVAVQGDPGDQPVPGDRRSCCHRALGERRLDRRAVGLLDQGDRFAHRVPRLVGRGTPPQAAGSGHVDLVTDQPFDPLEQLAVRLEIERLVDEPGDEAA